ncbi:MAG: hypothetical protein WC223_10855 [Bacteroidales bacterium]|jgi:hypothetical protein
MKNPNKLNEITSLYNKDVEDFVLSEQIRIVNDAKKYGIDIGVRGIINESNDKFSTVFGGIQSECELMGVNICKKLQPAVNFPEVVRDSKRVEEIFENTTSRIITIDNLITVLNSDKRHLNCEDVVANKRKVGIKATIIFIAEAIFNSMAFQFLGDNMLFSMGIALPVTFAFSEASKHIALKYKGKETPKEKRNYLFKSLSLVSIVVIALSCLRSLAFGHGYLSFGTLFYAIINMFLFIVAVFIYYMHYPTKEETRRYNEYKKINEEIKKLELEKKAILENTADLRKEYNNKQDITVKIDHYAKTNKSIVNMIFKLAVSKAKETYFLNNRSGYNPKCFNEVIPELNIDYDFNIYKNKEY